MSSVVYKCCNGLQIKLIFYLVFTQLIKPGASLLTATCFAKRCYAIYSKNKVQLKHHSDRKPLVGSFIHLTM